MENGRGNSRKKFYTEEQKTCAVIGGDAPNPPWIWENCGDFYIGIAPGTFNFMEPVQGKADDCYFIAALSSVAWVSPASLKAPPKNGPFSFTFYNPDPSVPRDTPVILSNQNLPRVSPGGAMIFATATSGETWPGIYEKAFALWNKCKNIQGTDYIDIRELKGGSAVNAMMSISGLQHMDAINVAKDTADNTIVNWFTGKCSATGKSNNPMIASTGDVNYIGNKPPLSQPANPPAGIYADHTYSLLGITKVGGTTFIILRNPYAGNANEFVDPNPTKPVGGWNGINLAANNDGIFPIEVMQFKKYFRIMGRVY